MKRRMFLLLITIMFILSFSNSIMATSKIDNLDVDVYNTFVVKKGTKLKLVSNKRKIKWTSKSKKIKIKNKIITARKTGKVVIVGKDKRGRQIRVKVNIKKKVNKVTDKNVTMNIKKNNDKIDITIYNKSDECVSANWLGTYIYDYETKNIVSKKTQSLVNAVFPHIYINPNGKYTYKNFQVENYNLIKGKEYYISIDCYGGNKLFNKKRHFTVKGSFKG